MEILIYVLEKVDLIYTYIYVNDENSIETKLEITFKPQGPNW